MQRPSRKTVRIKPFRKTSRGHSKVMTHACSWSVFAPSISGLVGRCTSYAILTTFRQIHAIPPIQHGLSAILLAAGSRQEHGLSIAAVGLASFTGGVTLAFVGYGLSAIGTLWSCKD